MSRRTWIKSATKVQGIEKKNYFKRLTTHDVDTATLTGEVAVINWSIQSFTVSQSHF